MEKLTVTRLREVLHYDPDTGVFTWRVATGRRIHVGDLAGSDMSNGYRTIGVDGRQYLAHRLAWLYTTGAWPKYGIDHRDRSPSNNRLANLRPASQSQNTQNKKTHANNQSGFKGVYLGKHGRKWAASIWVNGKSVHLGTFDTPEQAFVAYAFAARKYFGVFARLAGGRTFLIDKIITRLERMEERKC